MAREEFGLPVITIGARREFGSATRRRDRRHAVDVVAVLAAIIDHKGYTVALLEQAVLAGSARGAERGLGEVSTDGQGDH